jgi:heat-inducible transcriptional repressor
MPKRTKSNSELNERAQHLMRVLVQEYIRAGQPVGSKALAQVSGLDLSTATIRNIMADLENMGFLHSPHTSAGRVPTVQGYRFFVDSLVTVKPMERLQARIEQLKLELEQGAADTQSLASSVSEFLSGITSLAGIVTVPRLPRSELRQVEFLSLSENRVLAILVTNEREVQNRILQLPQRFSQNELQRIANYLNSEFVGKDITQLRADLLQGMRDARQGMDHLMRDAVQMAECLFAENAVQDAYVLKGQTNLMDFEELSNVAKLRQLFDAFNEKRDILHLLDQCLNAQGVQIFIGEESGYKVLDDLSVVTSTYSVDDQAVGVLGVIGPTRMRYEEIIPVVDVTAKILGAALNSK